MSVILSVVAAAAVGFFGWVAGLAGSVVVQERERLSRIRGILLTLREEVSRLRTEIGGPPEETGDLILYGSGAVVPSIHPWVHGIISETATVDPAIVREFMKLDRILHNLSVSKSQRDRAIDAHVERRTELEAAKNADDANTSDTFDAFKAVLEKERALERAEDAVERLTRFYGVNHRQVRESLDVTDSLLTEGVARTDIATIPGTIAVLRRWLPLNKVAASQLTAGNLPERPRNLASSTNPTIRPDTRSPES